MAFAPIVDTVAPAPSAFFAQNLLGQPLPTNSPWQNFVLQDGGQPEYIHPYLIQSGNGSLAIGYPDKVVQPGLIFQVWAAALIFSWATGGKHTVSSYDDLSVTLELPGPISVPLVKGSPYITFLVKGGSLNISANYTVLSVASNPQRTKNKISLSNGQSWVIYSSAPLKIGRSLGVAGPFIGTIRVAVLPRGSENVSEPILDRFSSAIPIAGHVNLTVPYRVHYKWLVQGSGRLLMLSHLVHRQILVYPGPKFALPQLTYQSIDGPLQGVLGDLWVLSENPIRVHWHSMAGGRGLNQTAKAQIGAALQADVANLQPINNTATYFFGKAVARAARFAVIADEIEYPNVTATVQQFLQNALNPWLDGTYPGNGLGYENKWGGIVSKNGVQDPQGDFGLGLYNDHYYHFGYFVYTFAVLARLNATWAQHYRPQVYAIVHDYMTGLRTKNSMYTRFRHFDLWSLHSWASGLTVFADGRNQESTSEAVNAYYSAALLGLAYRDARLYADGSTLAALEIRSAKTYWHVPLNSTVYDPVFVKENRVTGVVWSNKRDTALWFAPATAKESRTGIQIIPILPITELLFDDLDYARQLVDWTVPVFSGEGVTDGWKGFTYALQATYDKQGALTEVATLKAHDDGNSLSNLLWWIYTRPSP